LIEQAKMLAFVSGVDYLIGSFRPNDYGKYKAIYGLDSADFATYCQLKREDKLPVDSWLRNLTRNGMKPMKVDEEAMTVKSSLEALSIYKETYNVSMWNEICPSVWECGEVGSWFINAKNNAAVYVESNLWGIAWKKTGLK
ncbi:MAG: hypothetical protein ACD_19C00126G0004, partial [uncultured bacterium]